MRSVMTHNFSQVPKAEIPRSSFNRSCGYKTTFDAGYLIPIFVDEALPGDTFNLHMTLFTRLATPIYPLMDNIHLDYFFFAVPNRLIWSNWAKFNGEQEDPGDSTDFIIPTMTAPGTGYDNGSLSDYFGIPTEVPDLEHSSMWHRGYNLIWNDWFRDENLQDAVVVDKDDGPDDPGDYVLKKRGKRHDYFTSALPWPQKGDAVDLPIGTYGGDIITDGSVITFDRLNSTGTTTYDSNQKVFNDQSVSGSTLRWDGSYSEDGYLAFGNNTGLQINVDTIVGATINQLREAFQLQKLFERDARGGTRYTEIVKSHFGVTSPDFRLQRPEILGVGTSRININPVPQTSSTDGTSPQGNLAGYGVGTVNGNGFVKSFTEHCVIIGMVCVRADLTYQQGLDKMFSRSTRFDFYWPALSHLGEQAILNKEIYAQDPANVDGNGDSYNELVFGYQERYAEYRYKPSKITGQFRSNFAQSLDGWHLSQDFASLPVLNSTFIEENPPFDRVIAVPSYPHFMLDGYFDLKCARPMPVYSVPGLIDHF